MKFFKKKSATDTAVSKKERKVTSKEASFDFIRASKEFEKSRVNEIEKSEKRAWIVAIGATCIAIVSILAVVFLTPLKEVKPYVIRVDNNTGATDIVTELKHGKSDYQEQVSKYFSALYVRLVESYDWYTIQNQLNQALLFSDSNMQNRLNNKFQMANAPQKVHENKERVEVKINNTSIIDDKGLIQVRYTTKVVPTSGGSYINGDISPKPVEKKWIATIGYEYVNVPTLDDLRLVNPLGFTVKSYRVDEDGI